MTMTVRIGNESNNLVAIVENVDQVPGEENSTPATKVTEAGRVQPGSNGVFYATSTRSLLVREVPL